MSRQLAVILERAGVLPPPEISVALAQAEQSKRPLREVILAQTKVSEETLAEAMSQQLRLPFMKLAATTINPEVVRTLDEALARKYVSLAVSKEDDDDQVMRSLLGETLVTLSSNPEVITAENGAEALAMVEQKSPDLIILDVMMPGQTGFDVCEQLRRNIRTAFIPILMLTLNVDEQSRTKAFMVGTDDYMNKPISIPELHVRVSRLLRRNYGL